jgi:hypothetical protein
MPPGRGEVEPFGTEERLHLETPGGDRPLEALVEDPFVEGVLVDDFDPITAFDDKVAVVHLHRPFHAIGRHGFPVVALLLPAGEGRRHGRRRGRERCLRLPGGERGCEPGLR